MHMHHTRRTLAAMGFMAALRAGVSAGRKTGGRPPGTGLEGLQGGYDVLKSRRERCPGLWAKCVDEPSLSLLPDGERLLEELTPRLGERGGPLAPGPPREDPQMPTPHERLEGSVEGRPVEHEGVGKSTERDRPVAQIDGHEDGELRGRQIERRERGFVEARDRPRGATEPAARALDPDAGRQLGDTIELGGDHAYDVYASIGPVKTWLALVSEAAPHRRLQHLANLRWVTWGVATVRRARARANRRRHDRTAAHHCRAASARP